MNRNQIYPISLEPAEVKHLVRKHFDSELQQELRWRWGKVNMEYYGSVDELGNVTVTVTFSADDGFAMSCGRLLQKTFRPYDETRLLTLKRRAMRFLAFAEYERREEDRINAELDKIQVEMFGEEACLDS